MRVSRRLAVIFAVAGVTATCASAPAIADTGAATGFSFSQVPSTLNFDYLNRTITLTGTLSDTAGSPTTPLPNEPVTITEQVAGTGTAQDVATATTDSSGNFTVTLTNQSAGGVFEAVFAGDSSSAYAATTSSPVTVTPYPSNVGLTYSVTPQNPVPVGGTVTYSGTVYVPANDQGGTNPQTPIAGANVYAITGGGTYTSTSPHAVTDQDGKFSISLKPAKTADYWLEIVSNASSTYSLYSSDTLHATPEITVMNPGKPEYWLATQAGNVYGFNATGNGPLPGPAAPGSAIEGIAVDQATNGYWMATSNGNVYNYNAPWHGSAAGKAPVGTVDGIAADPKTGGYWLVTSAGNVYNYDAPWYGSMAGKKLPSPVTGIAAVGNGYVLVTAAGNVYNFNTPWHGSAAGKKFTGSVIGVAGDAKTGGYWLATGGGNVLNYDAPWRGSEAGATGVEITGIAADSSTQGYWLAGIGGDIYNFDAPSYGSGAGNPYYGPDPDQRTNPAIAIASSS